eukprot:gnl/TRDRNA2_/TRDRNA2_196686_c0_seq1.p1 gnl/TRDRNA2_/TRDRNA2_196686_c0~~gnl/TRDRNA2_/TRDRNA2_196686_c0_seq1.p1  ORF type:complete len:348 (-),score=67.37 gnl/TRDRNA2_/TRDRNA2_196686_c0_seq1:81-1124(-)
MGNSVAECTAANRAVAGCESAGKDCHKVVAYATSSELPHPNMVNQQLLRAAHEGDLVLLKIALAEGAFLETRRPLAIIRIDYANRNQQSRRTHKEGLTPLMHASKGGYLKCVRALLDAKANLQAEDEDGMTPIHFAAQSGDISVCRLLVERGASPNTPDQNGMLPIDHVSEEELSKTDEATGLRGWQQVFSPKEKSQPGQAAEGAEVVTPQRHEKGVVLCELVTSRDRDALQGDAGDFEFKRPAVIGGADDDVMRRGADDDVIGRPLRGGRSGLGQMADGLMSELNGGGRRGLGQTGSDARKVPILGLSEANSTKLPETQAELERTVHSVLLKDAQADVQERKSVLI